MSKLNILGIVKNIRSKTNVYTPIIEGIVNCIDAIQDSAVVDGRIDIIVKRDNALNLGDAIPPIKSLEIHDNGIGFDQHNRDSFDTFYSEKKIKAGGKGFGRFMFLKYFDNITVSSVYIDPEKPINQKRTFVFGKKFQIIENEKFDDAEGMPTGTVLYLNNVLNETLLDKELYTIARKLVEKLLIFFIDEDFKCPTIVLKESDESQQIVLNDFVSPISDIRFVKSVDFTVKSTFAAEPGTFTAKIFKIYFAGNQKSKVCLAANNREVTDTTLQTFIPEFEDDFFDEEQKGENAVRKNFIIKTYVQGKYLNDNVSHERETFNFDKEKSDRLYHFSQMQIEAEAANVTKDAFENDVKNRSDKKRQRVNQYVHEQAPWHKTYIDELDLSSMPYSLSDEKIEITLQTIKFKKEQEAKNEIRQILESEDDEFQEKVAQLISKISEAGKNDLAHYVSTRKAVLTVFHELLKRTENGDAKLEEEIHDVIFPLGKDSQQITYEDHNLWLLDERLVFTQYVASDKKLSKKKDALDEPDLLIFDTKKSFRSGENEYSNPLTIFEFKRPKRTSYKADDDPVLQIGRYLEKIREGKYETPNGVETIRVNDSTPVYGYVIADMCDKISEFAKNHQMTKSADGEGYFGYHSGYKMYIEIVSFKKLLKDANLRNRIFFRKLQIE